MSNEILDNLKQAVLQYNGAAAEKWARRAVDESVDPLKALAALTEAIRQVGDQFGQGELWLPDLVGASDAMLAATPVLQAEVDRRGVEKENLGTVVIGTVKGDIHNIGKSMVATLLTANGFEVHDVGVDVMPETFVEAIHEHQADILALSALMTTTAPGQRRVIEILKEEGIRNRVKVMVGGGGINETFAESIGADGYDPTAPGAVNLARSFVDGGEDANG
jgi:corrinoid protein of di/trimethylamine methyltransferase